MMNRIRLLLMVLAGMYGTRLGAQTIRVTGADDNQPVPSVHIHITPLNAQVEPTVLFTNNEGIAEVPAPYAGLEAAVRFSFLGYKTYVDTLMLEGPVNVVLKPENQTLNEVVITGQYAPNSPEKAVHRIKVIDRKKIDAMQAQNLRDVLTNELNIRLSQDNILGSSMSLQGISGENVKILIDGVPIIGRQNGNVDLSQVNLNNVERIEIIEGPMSVSYGTNALAGTINLITRKAQVREVQVSAVSYNESIGTHNLNGRVGFSKKKHTISISGGRNFFDGWNPGEDFVLFGGQSKPADSTRFQQWKPKEQHFGTLQYGYKLKDISLNYKGEFFNEKITNRGYPRMPYGETAFDDRYITRRIDNAVYLTGKVFKHHYLNFLAAYNDYRRVKNTFFRDLTTLDQVLTENASDQDTSKFNLINSRATLSTTNDSARINYEIGYDINVENAYGIRIEGNKRQIGDYAVFASAEYKPVKSLTIRPGLRYAYNTAYTSPLIPSLNIRYNLKESFTFRGSYARGFRAPTLKELYFYFVDINHNIVGNPDLQAEYSDNINLSASFNKTKGNKIFRLEAAGFYNNIRNLITLAMITGTEYTYANIGLHKTLGGQLNAEFGINHFKATIGGSYTGRYNQLSETASIDEFSYTPELRANVLYEFPKIGFTAAVFYKYTGEMPAFMVDNSNNIVQTFIGSYHTGDITLSKYFWKKRINLGIGTKNLFNVQSIYAVVSDAAHASSSTSMSVATGRAYFVKLEFNFNSRK